MAQPQFLIIEPGWASNECFGCFGARLLLAMRTIALALRKGAAYSFLLSLFPVLTTLISILIQVNAQSVVHVIATFVQQVVPPGTEDIVLWRLRERGAKPVSLPIVAIVLSLWAGSGAMISLMEGFQAAYRIPSGRPFLKQRAMAIFLVLIAAFPAVGASSLLIFGDRGEAAFIHWIGVSDISQPVEIAWRIARYVLAFCTTAVCDGVAVLFWTESPDRA